MVMARYRSRLHFWIASTNVAKTWAGHPAYADCLPDHDEHRRRPDVFRRLPVLHHAARGRPRLGCPAWGRSDRIPWRPGDARSAPTHQARAVRNADPAPD